MMMFQPRTGPTLAKTHKQFFASQLKPGERPDEWITELKKYRMEMDEMKSPMMDDPFLVHIVNNLTADYDLVVDIHNRRSGAMRNPLTITTEEVEQCGTPLQLKNCGKN
jgi:predicted Ser/Thr protein kinase